MKIERVIDGKNVTIELTDYELYDAFREKEYLYDVEDVRFVLDGKREDDPDYPELTAEELDKAARLLWHLRNNTEDWVYQAENAIAKVIGDRES